MFGPAEVATRNLAGVDALEDGFVIAARRSDQSRSCGCGRGPSAVDYGAGFCVTANNACEFRCAGRLVRLSCAHLWRSAAFSVLVLAYLHAGTSLGRGDARVASGAAHGPRGSRESQRLRHG